MNKQGHKNVLAIWFDLVSKHNSDFQINFSMLKIRQIFVIFFIEEYKNGRVTFIIDLLYFDTLDVFYLLKNGPKFLPLISKRTKSPEHLYSYFHRLLALLIHHLNSATLSCFK